VDAGVTGLTVVILRSMDPVRFSSRFLIIPLVTVLEGLVLLRPAVTSRLVVGIALLAVGAGCLILEKEPGKEEILTLR
jgi:drug/metabolite transporter (DMT)-like permease